MYRDRQHLRTDESQNSTAQSRAHLFAQLLLGNQSAAPVAGSMRSHQASDALEFAASISDRALDRLRLVR